MEIFFDTIATVRFKLDLIIGKKKIKKYFTRKDKKRSILDWYRQKTKKMTRKTKIERINYMRLYYSYKSISTRTQKYDHKRKEFYDWEEVYLEVMWQH